MADWAWASSLSKIILFLTSHLHSICLVCAVGSRLKNILLITAAFLLIAAIEAPSVIKLWHSFYSHKEIKCDQEGSVHIHSAEIDCPFQKFNVTIHYYLPQNHFDQILVLSFSKDHFNYYSSVSPFQELHFSLRGPPFST